MVSLVDSLDEKYGEDEDENEDFGFIVFVSSSPEAKSGLLPPIITLNDFNIERVGDHLHLRLSHIAELDLTDNLLSDWSEVSNILVAFPQLWFLNLSNNLLNQPIEDNANEDKLKPLDNLKLRMRKFVLNGNNVSWPTVIYLVERMPRLEELHLSANNLGNIDKLLFQHTNLRWLYLSCNPISDFDSLSQNLVLNCSNLEMLSIAECPIEEVPGDKESLHSVLHSLNLSTTRINSWEQVDRLRKFSGLCDLRIQGCPFLDELTAHERRMMLIARLPNIKVLNGGDEITSLEREDSERAFIRYFLDSDPSQRPDRFEELVQVHGLLDPLVNIDLTPEVNIQVKIYHGQECVEERVSVRQTVKQFKQHLQDLFHIAPANMRLYYYDQEMSKLVGPEEMKWGSKELYTYNVREGDFFVLDEKANNLKVKTSSSSSLYGSTSPSPRAGSGIGFTGLGARSGSNSSFGGTSPGDSCGSPTSPAPRRLRRTSSGSGTPIRQGNKKKSSPSPVGKSGVSRNLFGSFTTSNCHKFGEFHHSKVFRDPRE